MSGPSLSSVFPAAFARFGETLGPPCAEATPLPELLGQARLPALATQYAASFPSGGRGSGERRAALSLWSQYYLLALVPCATAAALAAGRELPIAFGGMGAVLTEEGQPCRLCVPHGGRAAVEACPVRRLAPLLRLHVGPLAVALGGAGLPPLVLWSNAAAVLSWSLDVIDAPAGERAAVRRAMTGPDWADGPNPFGRVLGHDPARRRICCLRFRLPGVGRCADCPALTQPSPGGRGLYRPVRSTDIR